MTPTNGGTAPCWPAPSRTSRCPTSPGATAPANSTTASATAGRPAGRGKADSMAYVPPDPPVVPYLMVRDGPTALAWYLRAFGGRQVNRYDMEDGRLGHAMLELGNGGSIYLADPFPELIDTVGTVDPDGLGGTTVTVALAVDDVDAWLARAVAEGAVAIRAPVDEFFGRHAKLRDPFGHVWSLTGPKRDS